MHDQSRRVRAPPLQRLQVLEPLRDGRRRRRRRRQVARDFVGGEHLGGTGELKERLLALLTRLTRVGVDLAGESGERLLALEPARGELGAHVGHVVRRVLWHEGTQPLGALDEPVRRAHGGLEASAVVAVARGADRDGGGAGARLVGAPLVDVGAGEVGGERGARDGGAVAVGRDSHFDARVPRGVDKDRVALDGAGHRAQRPGDGSLLQRGEQQDAAVVARDLLLELGAARLVVGGDEHVHLGLDRVPHAEPRRRAQPLVAHGRPADDDRGLAPVRERVVTRGTRRRAAAAERAARRARQRARFVVVAAAAFAELGIE
mmetsp:Transcript_7833/g.20624  ORF Transcript_7833/g.20624 Transcript_7833/m.20624 type:complete len:319 (-) Transcript_7833:46-1002(-)